MVLTINLSKHMDVIILTINLSKHVDVMIVTIHLFEHMDVVILTINQVLSEHVGLWELYYLLFC
jgi:hypothetical protein